jgi:outer membrane biogenesis lipoprotein LolB
MTPLRLVLASSLITATALLAACSSPSSQTTTQETSAQPAPMASDATTTQYRK